MTINIKRGEELVSYEIEEKNLTLLQVLTQIKTEVDSSLSFSSGCRSSVCGSCAMRVNGREVLACAYKPSEGDLIEPLRNVPVLRDLVVDMDKAYGFNKIAKAWGLPTSKSISVSPQDAKQNELQSDCILCGSCYSACPVYSVNSEFIGPFALTRSWKYVSDLRQSDISSTIAAVQTSGIYDCTLCGECVPVCPQGIAPKQDIVMLKNKSGVLGYMDPSFASSFGGGLTF
ncbi:4Fe-4S dicluster domain-containing protein [bacterium]|nr:4Fe-4S dicluster domain-containing protein [bacterium]MBU1884522.1 4Fe-4S dicluster domain-containing protein [bacterium]